MVVIKLQISLQELTAADVEKLQPFLTQPALLMTAGMDYQPSLGYWGFQMLLQDEQLFLLTIHDQPAGLILVSHCYDWDNQILPEQVEIGYCVLPTFQHQGIATHGLQLLLQQLTRLTDYQLVIAKVQATNDYSKRALASNHFQHITGKGQIEQWQYQIKR